MSIRLYGRPELHRLGAEHQDSRLAYTACGLLFAWGRVPLFAGRRMRCPGCWA